MRKQEPEVAQRTAPQSEPVQATKQQEERKTAGALVTLTGAASFGSPRFPGRKFFPGVPVEVTQAEAKTLRETGLFT